MKMGTHSGFTIVEALVYLALLSLLITGGLVSVYAVAESTERNRTSAHVEQEGNFILGTMRFSLQGARVLNPTLNGLSSELSIQTSDGEILLFTSIDDRISVVDEDGNAALSSFRSKGLQFVHEGVPDSSLDPERFQISFTLIAESKGHPVQRVFSDEIYPNAP